MSGDGSTNERQFGRGDIFGGDQNFLDLPIEEQVVRLGWSHACPIVDQVIRDYGPEWTRQRYAECNFIFGLVVESAKDLNPQLAQKLTMAVPRLPDEPPGIFDPRFTPEIHKSEMSPLSTLWGYAIPRVITEEMGRGKNNEDRTSERMLKALEIVDEIIKESESPIELAVKLSEAVSKSKADPKAVLGHLLAANLLEEENCRTMFETTAKKMKESAPVLNKVYESLSGQEKKELGIAIL